MPGFPVVITPSGGLPVSNVASGQPAQIASNGYGTPVTIVPIGLGLPLNIEGAGPPVAGSAVQNYTFGTSTPTTIPLSFDPPATGTTPFTYRVEYRLTSSSGAWTVATSNLATTSYTVTGLTPDTSYSIRIIPQNAAGDGTPTSKSRTTAAAATKPATMAAPSLSSTANSIAVTRAAAPADGGSPITGYDLQYRTGAGAWTIVAMNANPQTISGLTASTTYEVQTRAVNAIGPGDWSPSASIATQAGATAPAQMAAPSLVAGNQSIAVTRAAAPNDGGSPITGYDILYRTGSGAFTVVAMTSNPQTLTGLLNGQVYEVQTRAVNAIGNGTPSPSATATPVAAAFDVLALGPAMWMDAADASSLSVVDGKVAQANDKSGNARHAMQATAANQPSYSAAHSVANNKPALFNTAANGVLTTDATVTIEEVYVVAAFANGAETSFTSAATGWATGYSALFGGTGTNGMPRMMGDVNTANFINSSAFAMGAFRNRETVQRGTGVAGQPTILPLPLSVLRIQRQTSATLDTRRNLMNQASGAGRAWTGPWCEFIAFSAPLAETDRNALIEHLIAKWGVIV